MYTMQIPVLSTAHIGPTTDRWIQQEAYHTLAVVALYEGGYFLYISGIDRDDPPKDLPDDLFQVIKWAQDRNFDWVRIDAIGEMLTELPTYTW